MLNRTFDWNATRVIDRRQSKEISSFLIGAGTFFLFAMLLERLMYLLVIQVYGLNDQSNCGFVMCTLRPQQLFLETRRILSMKFWMKSNWTFRTLSCMTSDMVELKLFCWGDSQT